MSALLALGRLAWADYEYTQVFHFSQRESAFGRRIKFGVPGVRNARDIFPLRKTSPPSTSLADSPPTAVRPSATRDAREPRLPSELDGPGLCGLGAASSVGAPIPPSPSTETWRSPRRRGGRVTSDQPMISQFFRPTTPMVWSPSMVPRTVAWCPEARPGLANTCSSAT